MSVTVYGYVYVVQMEGHPWLKIGRTVRRESEAVLRRVKNMQTGCPLPLHIVKEYPCHDPVTLEQSLHKLLARYRRDGEWFDTTIEQIERAVIAVRHNPAVWKEAIEKEREAERAHAAAYRAAFEAKRASDQAENVRRQQEREALWAHQDAERGRNVQTDMREFARARKQRRLRKIAREVGVLGCGMVLGVAAMLLILWA